MSEARQGILAMVVACLTWGLVPLFYKQLEHIPPIEILAHRTIWSAVIFVGVLLFQGRLKLLGEALLSRRTVVVIAAAAFLISFNWYFFIWSVSQRQGHGGVAGILPVSAGGGAAWAGGVSRAVAGCSGFPSASHCLPWFC